MALAMKPACEKCQAATPPEEFVFICSYECTFCKQCTVALDYTCPNCGGELTTRPRRFAAGNTAR